MDINYSNLAGVSSDANGRGRMSLPIYGQARFSDFSYVSNLSDQDNTAIFSEDRNRILALLIGQAELIRAEPHESSEAPLGLSASRVDALIQQYAIEVHNLATANKRPIAAPALFAEPGILFSISA